MSGFDKDPRSALAIAEDIITGERAKAYGDAGEQFDKVARMFNLLAGTGKLNLTGDDVLLMMICLKLVREAHDPTNRDHLIDAAGYIGLLDKIKVA